MTIPPHYEPAPTEVLYHYTSARAAAAITQGRTFWLSDYSKMNDPLEFQYPKEALIEILRERHFKVEQIPRWLVAGVLAGIETETLLLIGCLTQQRDSRDQWRRYGDNARGCVIGIDASYLASEVGVAIKRVNYEPSELRRFLHAGLMMLQSEYEAQPGNPRAVLDLARWFGFDLFAFKAPTFSMEREIRISRLVTRGDGQDFRDPGGISRAGTERAALELRSRNGPQGVTRYVELPLNIAGCPCAIRSIGFGANCPADARAELQSMAQTLPEPAELWDSDVNPD